MDETAALKPGASIGRVRLGRLSAWPPRVRRGAASGTAIREALLLRVNATLRPETRELLLWTRSRRSERAISLPRQCGFCGNGALKGPAVTRCTKQSRGCLMR